MPSTPIVRLSGLQNFPNYLSQIPEGSLLQATNTVIDRNGIVEPRRGFKVFGTTFGSSPTTDIPKQLFSYKNRVLVHFTNTLAYASDGAGTFLNFSGSVTEPEAGIRIKSIEQNGNFYFTSTQGIRKLSALTAADFTTASGFLTNAGGVKALDTQLSLNPQTGFLSQDGVVGYRIVWGIKDRNDNVILGTPSERTVISNPITGLLIRDFNALLIKLDAVNNPGGINEQNYSSTLKLNLDATSDDVRNGVISLAAKLDGDTIITEGAIDVSTSQRVTTTTASIVFNSSVATFLQTGDRLHLSGFTNTDMNGKDLTITNVSTTTVTASLVTGTYSGTDGAPVAESGASTVQRLKYTLITQPGVLSSPATDAQLLAVQAYYDNIVDDLQIEPSGIITNTVPFDTSNSTQSATVNVTFTIPSAITTAYFYQIYRTAVTVATGTTALSTLDPGDEMGLVFEGNPTSADLAAKSITVHDVTPDAFRGANLYTNPVSGETIAQANEVPPLAKDITSFKGSTLYANTQTRQRLALNMLGVVELTSGVSTITVTDGITTNTYTFVLGVAEVQTITTVAAASIPQSSYFYINSGNNTTAYYVWFNKASGGTDPLIAGKTGIEVDLTGTETNAQVATAVAAALNKNNDFTASALSNVVTVTNQTAGISTAATNGAVSPGFAYAVLTPGQGEDAANKKVLISSLATTSQQVDETARSLVRVINKQSTEVINAFYLSGPTDIPGIMNFEAKSLNQVLFYVLANSSSTGVEFSPNLSPSNAISNISVANPTVITSTAHGLSSGQMIVISGSNSTPSIDGVYTITRIDANTFSIPVNVTISGNRGGWILTTNTLLNASNNEVNPNRFYYSKSGQPEAVPLLNFIDVGAKDSPIYRIIALRDSVFILKSDAVYRLTGETTADFTVSLFDNSTFLLAPDTASVLNNQIYMFSSQGISTISDTGISVISRPIENLIIGLSEFNSFYTASFGVGYESDRSYTFWTVTRSTDTKATQAFRYNTFTQTWTDWAQSKNCALSNLFDEKLYLGPTDLNNIEQERKTFDRLDYADRQYNFTIGPNAINGNNITLNSITNIQVGDAIQQVQYLSFGKFNRLLKKLDTISSIILSHRIYFANFQLTPGLSMRTQLNAVASNLDTSGDTNGGFFALMSAGTDFPTIQSDFNAVIDRLNSDSKISNSTFTHSTGTVTFENHVTAINKVTDTVTVDFQMPYVQGPVTDYNRIATIITWAPHFFQDPSIQKHVRESTLIFEHNNISNATMSFSSDLQPGFDSIPFQGSGDGAFGQSFFGETFFGGDGAPIPFRTLVPLEKQRCRYLNCQYQHSIAFQKYSILGVSHAYEISSTRAWR